MMALAAAEKDWTWRGHTVTHHQKTAIPKDTTTTARSVTVDSHDVVKDDTRGPHQAPGRALGLVEEDRNLTREDVQKISKEIPNPAESRFHLKNQRKRFIEKNEQQGQSVKRNHYLDFHI